MRTATREGRQISSNSLMRPCTPASIGWC
jgi:hypothetical protein